MTAYLSKIAARFDGSSVKAKPESQNATPALMPSSVTFGTDSATEIDFVSAPYANEMSFLESNYSHGEEALSEEEKILKPTPNFIGTASTETIRSFFYSENTFEQIDQESFESGKVIVPQKKINQEDQYPDEIENLKPSKAGSDKKNEYQPSQEMVTDDLQLGPIAKEAFPSTPIGKQELKDKKNPVIIPSRKHQKEPLSIEEKTVSKGKIPSVLPTDFLTHPLSQKEVVKGQPQIKQLRPAMKKQRFAEATMQKSHHENKIRIGSIRVEIIPAKPKKIKTQRQQLPQQKVNMPSKVSVNQARFPLRFGLKQM